MICQLQVFEPEPTLIHSKFMARSSVFEAWTSAWFRVQLLNWLLPLRKPQLCIISKTYYHKQSHRHRSEKNNLQITRTYCYSVSSSSAVITVRMIRKHSRERDDQHIRIKQYFSPFAKHAVFYMMRMTNSEITMNNIYQWNLEEKTPEPNTCLHILSLSTLPLWEKFPMDEGGNLNSTILRCVQCSC